MAGGVVTGLSEVKEVPPTARRLDGCQNCKTSRIKCDKTKPSCGCCTRRKEVCNYSKIQFNTINKRTHDKRTGRKLKIQSPGMTSPTLVTSSEASVSAQSSPSVPKTPICIIQECPGQTPVCPKTPQLPTPVSSPSASEASSHRLSNIHQLLWPTDAWVEAHQHAVSRPATASSTSASGLPSPEVASQSLGQPQNRELRSEEADRTWSSFAEALEHQEMVYTYDTVSRGPQGSLPNDGPCGVPSNGFADFTVSMDPAIVAILRHSNARLLLHHYLHRSIATLHPQLGCSEHNISGSVLLPYCLAYPVALEAILAFSASQLSLVDSRQAEAVLYHKMCSIKHLNQLVHQQAFPSSPGRGRDYGMHLVVSVLSQISISVSESGVDTWEMHCRAAYSILIALRKPEAWECSRNLEAYLYCRLLKYICFAEIAKPSERFLDLSIIQGSNLTVEFGVPSDGLKLAVMISKYVFMLSDGQPGEVVAGFGEEITKLLRQYLTIETFEDAEYPPEYHLMESIWRSTIWLYYYRCVYGTSVGHETSMVALSRIVDSLKRMPVNSLYSTALAFPVQTVAPLITQDDHDLRIWFSHYCQELAYATNTRNFIKVGEYSKVIWAAMDAGTCSTMMDVRKLADETGYRILLA